nr:MFS transporter [Mesorhizobium sp.]
MLDSDIPYAIPGWTFFRHCNRLTAADKEVGRHLLALHDGELPPSTVLSIERTTETARTRAQLLTVFSRSPR